MEKRGPMGDGIVHGFSLIRFEFAYPEESYIKGVRLNGWLAGWFLSSSLISPSESMSSYQLNYNNKKDFSYGKLGWE